MKKKHVVVQAAKKSVARAVATSNKTKKKRNLAKLKFTLSEYLSGTSLDFVMSQCHMANVSATGRRWSTQQKAFALSLLHASPKAYKLLRRVFLLPSTATLKRAVSAINIYPGTNENILEGLRLKVATMNERDRAVAMVIDEMSLREALYYDKQRDVVEGFVEVDERQDKVANHALVFLVRGLIKKWKQPVNYYVTSGPMSADDIKPLLHSFIDQMESINLNCLVLICDQGSNNQRLVKTLLGIYVNLNKYYHRF